MYHSTMVTLSRLFFRGNGVSSLLRVDLMFIRMFQVIKTLSSKASHVLITTLVVVYSSSVTLRHRTAVTQETVVLLLEARKKNLG